MMNVMYMISTKLNLEVQKTIFCSKQLLKNIKKNNISTQKSDKKRFGKINEMCEPYHIAYLYS